MNISLRPPPGASFDFHWRSRDFLLDFSADVGPGRFLSERFDVLYRFSILGQAFRRLGLGSDFP